MIKGRVKKSDIDILGGVVSEGLLSLSIISILGPWGAPQSSSPLWCLANIKCVVANITCGAIF